jgi:hypothetical protein
MDRLYPSAFSAENMVRHRVWAARPASRSTFRRVIVLRRGAVGQFRIYIHLLLLNQISGISMLRTIMESPNA